ncbi:MAG: S1 RNA-binding domain-containing protein [Anaerolineae bacterium]|nr:S1 RNA-binding domain-containing protein [Anaerolineae bacterium]
MISEEKGLDHAEMTEVTERQVNGEETPDEGISSPVDANPDVTSENADSPSVVATAPPGDTLEDEPTEQETVEEVENNSLSDSELFLAALNEDPSVLNNELDDFLFAPLRRGQIVKGMIASVSDSEILIDVGAKSEGMISGRELEMLGADYVNSLEVGQEVNVYVLTPEDRNGHTQLSLRRALEEQDWIDAEQYNESKDIYTSKITGFNKGGLIIRFGKVRGFVPASQIGAMRRRKAAGNTPEERWADMVGDDISVKVIEVDRGRNRLIVSERAADRELMTERRADIIDSLSVGMVQTGQVVRLTDFGAFVDLGGIDGLIHISEMAWKHIKHPKEVLRVGEDIEVEIINIDKERQRIGLSRKKCLEDPWSMISRLCHIDQLVQGRVTNLTAFGAFARLVDYPEIEGLIHISELSERRIKHPQEVVNEGDILTLRIIRIDADKRRMGLSLKRVDSEEYMDEDWQDMLTTANDDEPEESAEPIEVEEEPAAGQEAVEEPAEDSVEESIVEEAADEPVEEPLDEPAEEPVEEPLDEPVEELVEEPVDEALEEAADSEAEFEPEAEDTLEE